MEFSRRTRTYGLAQHWDRYVQQRLMGKSIRLSIVQKMPTPEIDQQRG